MKKNRMMRTASVLLVAVLLSTCAISGTFAKYTSTVTDSDSVTVAKWSVKVNGTEIAVANPSVIFNLFDTNTQYDEDGNDVTAGKIAPGTKGSFNFKVQNTSEVSVKYTITFTATFPEGIDSTRFKFYSDENMQNELVAANGKYTAANAVEIEVADSVEKTVNVYWQWTFGEDANDTTLGILAQNGTTVVTVAPTITVEQVD